MRWMSLTVGSFCFLLAVALAMPATAAAQEPDAPTKGKVDALKRQIEDLQKRIDGLQQQMKTLLQDADDYNKVSVEIKGRLRPHGKGADGKSNWIVTAKGIPWRLDFGDKAEWIDLAKKLDGKTVLVTGTAVQAGTHGPYGLRGFGGMYGGGLGGSGGIQGGLGGYPGFGPGMTIPIFTVKVETFKAP